MIQVLLGRGTVLQELIINYVNHYTHKHKLYLRLIDNNRVKCVWEGLYIYSVRNCWERGIKIRGNENYYSHCVCGSIT